MTLLTLINENIYMKRISFSPLAMLVALIIGLMTVSCSKKSELLDTIPADVKCVAMMDVKGMLENAGAKFTSEGIEVPEALNGTDVSGLITLGKLHAAGACDISEIALIVYGKQELVFTFFVTDWEKFKTITSSLNWEEGNDGYTEGRVNGVPVLSDGTQCWMVIGSNPYETVNSLRESAKKEPISKLAGISGVLESDHLLNLALSQMTYGDTDNNTAQQLTIWQTLSASVSDNKIVATAQSMKGDGEKSTVKGMQHINPAVLSYVPANFNFALAAGFTPEFDWATATSALSSMFARNFQMQGAIAMLTPFLKAIDGTVLLAAGPSSEESYKDLDPSGWQFLLMAHLPQERINQVMTMIRGSLAQNGISPIDERDGVMTIPQYGMEFHVGNVDGYLALSNIPFENTRQNSLAPMFVNKDAAMTLEIPSLQLFSESAPAYGLKIKVEMGESEGKAEISLPGAKLPILETLLNTIYDK